jgi:hypothetical protein
MWTMHKQGGWAAAALALGLLAGCDLLPGGYTPIREIATAPGRFENTEVKVKGTASGALGIPFSDYRVFLLKDETGEILILTKEALPPANATVALRGTVLTAAIVGGIPLGLRIEETKRLR